ncbi:MAG: M15 family metallopeptidase [Bacilli bacterium]|nr:M15 family metallopeptidase [Bacilli bacterium]
MILLINKKHFFNEEMLNNYEMIEYENYNEDTLYVESDTFRHFEMLKAHLRIEGIVIDIKDAYRSLETQESIFLKCMNKYGIDKTEDICAMPGTSDHHTGCAIDLCLNVDGHWICEEELFFVSEFLERIHKVLKYFGFILRYPKDKDNITGFSYEPWHIRYVGDEIAMEIGDLTLEEYLDK